MITAGGGELYTCKLAMDMFMLTKDDLYEGVLDVLTIGHFYVCVSAINMNFNLRQIASGNS